MEWVKWVVAILSGLATAIPLAIKLVEYVRKYIQEKNYGKLMELVMDQMMVAEQKMDDGATRKSFVMASVLAAANKINYDIDEVALSQMIDALCDMSKVVNAKSPDDASETKAGEKK